MCRYSNKDFANYGERSGKRVKNFQKSKLSTDELKLWVWGAKLG